MKAVKVIFSIVFGVSLLSFPGCKPEAEKEYGRAGNILEEGKTWSYVDAYVYPNPNNEGNYHGTTHVCYVEGETEIDGVVWKKAYSSIWGSMGLYRQEGQRIYKYVFDFDFGPICIFDFDKTVGDVLYLREQKTATVVRVFDSVFGQDSQKAERRCMELLFDGGGKDLWVEGIGSLSCGFFSSTRISSLDRTQIYSLLCCEKDGISLYKNAVFDTCFMEGDLQDFLSGE